METEPFKADIIRAHVRMAPDGWCGVIAGPGGEIEFGPYPTRQEAIDELVQAKEFLARLLTVAGLAPKELGN